MALRSIPAATRRRLASVLHHLDGRRDACGHAQGCGGSEPVDLEDLARGLGHDASLFDPERYAETTKPLLEASTLPGDCYRVQAWYDRELARAFEPSWTLMGREDEIAEAGQFLAIDTAWAGPVAVCRGSDGGVHGFANVCRHRGAKVLQGSMGKAGKIGLVCPYHAWTYDYNGQLKWAPGMEQAQDFDEESIRLQPVRVESFHGFIFVCASGEPRSLADTLGDLPEHASPWFGPEGRARDMVTVGRREYSVPCNWKLLMENTCETYHTSVVHRNSLGPMKSTPLPPHQGHWDAVEVQSGRSVVPLPEDFEGEQFPLPAFTDRTCFISLFPALQINVTWDCLWWMRLIPTGIESTDIVQGFCFPRETTELPHFPKVLERYRERWHIAVSEDNTISLNQQRGLKSRLRVPGRFHPLEFGTHNFNNWLLSKVVYDESHWDPGRRVIVARDPSKEAWSNDDPRLLTVVDESGVAKEDA